MCTEGQASDACRAWLAHLVGAGCRLAYHGDFDWAGIHIARQVLTGPLSASAEPWRFGADDYLAAVDRLERTRPLAGVPVGTPWDPGLAEAMAHHERTVFEEQVVADLLADLCDG